MDPTALPATWQEALENHPVSNVKAFEKQLRASALRDREKLRALVGSNYRELLSTAEQIVELDEQNRQAEISISALGQACRMPDELSTVSTPSKAAISASHIRLTDRLLRFASRVTKERSVLLASRLITIARLLVKHLEQDYGSSKTGQWLTIRLKNGRQHLLSCIDSMFVRPTTSLDQLAQAAGAYCLTTSSSSDDVTRHFRTLRLQRLAQGLPGEGAAGTHLKSDLKQRCHYFIASVTAIKTLTGRGIVDLLNSLQKHPILEDRELLAIETLQLDIVKNLLPADIITFTPYFKKTTSSPSEVRSYLQQWVDEASRNLSGYVASTIENSSLKSVVRTRQFVLDILLPDCFSTLSHGTIVTTIRQIFSDRIIKVIQQQTQTLELLGSEIQTIVESVKPSEASIWQSELPRKVTTRPPPSALRDIRKCHLGISNDLNTYLNKLRKWLQTCQQTQQQIETLSKVRWQDKLEEFDEDEEEAAQDLITSLSKTDPAQYLRTFHEAAEQAADSFIENINKYTSHLAQRPTEDAGTASASQIATLLRITREINHILRSLLPTKDLSPLRMATRTLHSSLAEHTTASLFDRLAAQVAPQSGSTFTPPDLPSASTISVLKTLCTLMTEVGGMDIWSTSATVKLKRAVFERVLDGDVKERYVQSEVDDAYLRVALGGSETEGEQKHNNVDVDVQRRAATLWSRSRLLFGMLGGQNALVLIKQEFQFAVLIAWVMGNKRFSCF